MTAISKAGRAAAEAEMEMMEVSRAALMAVLAAAAVVVAVGAAAEVKAESAQTPSSKAAQSLTMAGLMVDCTRDQRVWHCRLKQSHALSKKRPLPPRPIANHPTVWHQRRAC